MKIFTSCLLTIIIVSGCKSKPSYIGTWTSELDSTNLIRSGKAEMTLGEDGTYKQVVRMSKGAAVLVATDIGTYRVSQGDTLTVVISDVKWEVEGASAQTKANAEARFATNRGAIIKSANAQPPVKFELKDGKLTIDEPKQGKVVWSRKG